MRVKLPKYESGGPFVGVTPVISSGSPHVAQLAQPTVQNKLVDDDSNKMLEKGGLTSDYYIVINELEKLEDNPLSFIDSSTSDKAIRLMRGKINEMINNKAIWEDSVKNARASGAYNEIAIEGTGKVFYRDDLNSIKETNLADAKKNKRNLLTVAELLDERQRNLGLAFNQSIFDVANQTVGMKQITEHVMNLFDTLSEVSIKTERTYDKEDIKRQYENEKRLIEQGGKKPTNEEMSSIQSLIQKLNTPGEFIKETVEEKGKGKNIQSALNYIWKTLGEAAQKKLEVKAYTEGTTVEAVLGGMLDNYGAKSVSSTIEPVKGSSVKDTDEQSKGKESLTAFQMFHKDKLASPLENFVFNDPKTSLLFRGAAGAVGPLVDRKDQSIGMASLSQVLSQFDYNLFVDGTKAFFGNKKIIPENAGNVVYDGQTAAKVYMPTNSDGSPDYEAFEQFKEIYNEYEKNKDRMTKGEAEKFFSDNGYNLKIDEVYGEKVIRDNAHVKPFLLMYAYTNDATGLIDDKNIWVNKLSKNEEETIKPILEQIWTIGTGKNVKNITQDKSWNREDYYKGIVTIPYRTTYAAIVDALVNQGPKDQIMGIGDVQRNLRYSSNIPQENTTSASVL